MWRARLALSDKFTVNSSGKLVLAAPDLVRGIIDVGRRADIVNLSVGLYWQEQFGHKPQNIKKHQDVANAVYGWMVDAIEQLEQQHSRRPLFVIAAGNDGEDAYWSGLPRAVRDYPDRVIVVAASTRAGGRPSYSNYNKDSTFVSIMAPGHDVRALTGAGAIQAQQGTSFAAPMVSGIAGLIRSFDPRLPVDSIKHYILLGAQRGGRTVAGLPLANAYESLRAVAERNGAPLCGNRMWIENDSVKVARDTLGHRRETLFSVPQRTRGLHALHGGKHIRYTEWPTLADRLLEWQEGAWVPSSVPADSIWRLEGPVWRSEMGYSHDLDSALVIRQQEGGVQVYVRHIDGGEERHIGTVTIPRQTRTGGPECVRRRLGSVECEREEFIGSNLHRDDVYGAYGPQGDIALVSVARRDENSTIRTGWYICPGPNGEHDIIRECRDWDQTTGTADAHVYAIPTSGSTAVSPRWSDTGVRVRELGIADGPREFYLRREGSRSWSVHSWIYEDGRLKETTTNSGSVVIPCTTQFRRLANGALLQERPGCAWTDATFAPSRQAHIAEQQRSARTPAALVARFRNWRRRIQVRTGDSRGIDSAIQTRSMRDPCKSRAVFSRIPPRIVNGRGSW
jgi:hypothetical protein